MSTERSLTPAERAERRRRLAAVFGETLPEQTRDDLDAQDDPAARAESSEERLRREVPPHHGTP